MKHKLLVQVEAMIKINDKVFRWLKRLLLLKLAIYIWPSLVAKRNDDFDWTVFYHFQYNLFTTDYEDAISDLSLLVEQLTGLEDVVVVKASDVNFAEYTHVYLREGEEIDEKEVREKGCEVVWV